MGSPLCHEISFVSWDLLCVMGSPLCHGIKSLGSYCQVLDATGGYTEPVSAILSRSQLSRSRLHSGLGYARFQVQLYSVEGILIYLLYTLFDLQLSPESSDRQSL